jgi:hypothetical protein
MQIRIKRSNGDDDVMADVPNLSEFPGEPNVAAIPYIVFEIAQHHGNGTYTAYIEDSGDAGDLDGIFYRLSAEYLEHE